jgi:hypothetical protein
MQFCLKRQMMARARTHTHTHTNCESSVLISTCSCPWPRTPTKHILFSNGPTAPTGPGPHYRGFTITLRHTTLGWTPLDEWSARRRDLYLTTHNTHKRQTSMPPGGIRTRNPRKRTAADPRLRPHSHWDRLLLQYSTHNPLLTVPHYYQLNQ